MNEFRGCFRSHQLGLNQPQRSSHNFGRRQTGYRQRAIDSLALFGVRFSPTSAQFARTTSYFLRPFKAGARDRGASIERDVFKGFSPAPTAAEVVERWGDFQPTYQNAIERRITPNEQYVRRAIGGERGELLYRRWQQYCRVKEDQRTQLLALFNDAMTQAMSKAVEDRTHEDDDLLANPKLAEKELLETAKAMKFSYWVEFQADRGDLDAQWLVRVAANGTNQDADACAKADAEGAFGTGDDLKKMRTLVRFRDAERKRRIGRTLQKKRPKTHQRTAIRPRFDQPGLSAAGAVLAR